MFSMPMTLIYVRKLIYKRRQLRKKKTFQVHGWQPSRCGSCEARQPRDPRIRDRRELVAYVEIFKSLELSRVALCNRRVGRARATSRVSLLFVVIYPVDVHRECSE